MPIPATAPTPCRVLDNGVVQLTPTTKRVPPSQETPSLKPHEHLTHTPRNTYGRLIQCQTSHAFLGEYYATNMSPQKTSPAFAVNQSRRRTTLASCPSYENHRYLKGASEGIVTSDILGTKEGVEALMSTNLRWLKFLDATNAFKKQRIPPEVVPVYHLSLGSAPHHQIPFHSYNS